MELRDQFFATARERYHISLLRAEGRDHPWTRDPVFGAWRFCCVHREWDRTTTWLRTNIRDKIKDKLRVARAVVAFRWFNRIETGEKLLDLLVGRWDPVVAIRRLQGVTPVVTGAYMIRSPTGMEKAEGIVDCIEGAAPLLEKDVPRWGGSLEEAWQDLRGYPYLGPFLAYELVSDLRWTSVLRRATDVETWANAGPGCARGLSRVVSGGLGTFRYCAADQSRMLETMRELLAMSRRPEFWPTGWQPWEMREVEHWACEFDKYRRVVEGGTLKRRYP